MRWAKVAVALGLALVVVGFCVGVDTPTSTTVAGQPYACQDVVPVSWLVSGQSGQAAGPASRTPAERRLDARIATGCAPGERVARWAVWGGIGLGALLVLTGWTALREREHDEQVAERRTRAMA